jgi:hypothetical protein
MHASMFHKWVKLRGKDISDMAYEKTRAWKMMQRFMVKEVAKGWLCHSYVKPSSVRRLNSPKLQREPGVIRFINC